SLVAVLIPYRWRCTKLIVGLNVVGAVVSRGPQVFRKSFHFRRRDDRVLAGYALNFRIDVEGPHVMTSHTRLIHSCDDRTATRSAYPSRCKRAIVEHTFSRKTIDIRCRNRTVAVAIQPRTHVFNGQPKNVGTIAGIGLRPKVK